MRASTLFGLTIAILIGMAVVFGVKSSGLFSRPVVVATNPDRPKVLVFRSGSFEGLASMSTDVIVRPVDDTEMDQYMKNKHKYMPPIPEAVNFRILARNVYSNEPLLKEHFKDLGLPESFGGLLGPGMRAVNLKLPREDAGGGPLRKGDLVDVLLTTSICTDPSCQYPRTASAPIAFGLKIIIKNDSIFGRMKELDDKPMSFTLEANPYRAALIEFAKTKGRITLVPTGPHANKGKLDMTTGVNKDEETRILRYQQNNSITDRDLEEIFKLAAIPLPPPPIYVEHIGGIQQRGTSVFPRGSYGNGRPSFQAGDGTPSLGYSFQSPDAGKPRYVDCPSCPGGKKLVPN